MTVPFPLPLLWHWAFPQPGPCFAIPRFRAAVTDLCVGLSWDRDAGTPQGGEVLCLSCWGAQRAEANPLWPGGAGMGGVGVGDSKPSPGAG